MLFVTKKVPRASSLWHLQSVRTNAENDHYCFLHNLEYWPYRNAKISCNISNNSVGFSETTFQFQMELLSYIVKTISYKILDEILVYSAPVLQKFDELHVCFVQAFSLLKSMLWHSGIHIFTSENQKHSLKITFITF